MPLGVISFCVAKLVIAEFEVPAENANGKNAHITKYSAGKMTIQCFRLGGDHSPN